jgi:hypothetical protein
MQVLKNKKSNGKLLAIKLPIFFLTKVPWVLLFQKIILSSDGAPPCNGLLSKHNGMNVLQVQEALSDHGDDACSFSTKTNQGGTP